MGATGSYSELRTFPRSAHFHGRAHRRSYEAAGLSWEGLATAPAPPLNYPSVPDCA